MKINLFDTNPEAKNRPNSPLSFETVNWNLNEALKALGHYAEPQDADFVGTINSLDIGFKYKGKDSFLIHVWETLNALPIPFVQQARQAGQRVFGLSNQITNLWRKMNYPNVATVYGGCDTDFWHQTKPKNPDFFQFFHVSHSNVRSGLDLTLLAFTEAFANDPRNIKLVIKDMNGQDQNSKLMQRIEECRKRGAKIDYISERWDLYKIRELYSESHVTLNMLRATSFGLPLLEASACNSLVVTGDIPSPNEIITPEFGVLLRPSAIVSIRSRLQNLTEYWGLRNAYPNTLYMEEPTFADYDVNDYADLLKEIYRNYNTTYKDLPMRQTVVRDWTWRRGAEMLVQNLSV